MPGEHTIAYYPDETPLFKGTISIMEITDEVNPTVRVSVEDEPSLDLEIVTQTEAPIRTVHTGYFLRHGESAVRACNVDLELSKQPDQETIARAILATHPEN